MTTLQITQMFAQCILAVASYVKCPEKKLGHYAGFAMYAVYLVLFLGELLHGACLGDFLCGPLQQWDCCCCWLNGSGLQDGPCCAGPAFLGMCRCACTLLAKSMVVGDLLSQNLSYSTPASSCALTDFFFGKYTRPKTPKSLAVNGKKHN